MNNLKKIEKQIDRETKVKEDKVELCFWGKKWFIRKGICQQNCICDGLTKKDLEKLWTKIGRILEKVNNKKKIIN
jgi:hypothetical protein